MQYGTDVHRDGLAALLIAESDALRAAQLATVTCDRIAVNAYTRLDPAATAPLRGGVPEAPLVCAVDDLASTAYAAARAIHFAIAAGEERPREVLHELAETTVRATDIAVDATGHRYDVTGLRLRVELAHAAAVTAHRAADALALDAAPVRRSTNGRPPTPFPPSWRRLCALLSDFIVAASRREASVEPGAPPMEQRLDAARAARDAAMRAMAAYDCCRVTAPSTRLLLRCARLASRAAAHAGFAALRVPPAPIA